jgi:hypothetical protein
MGCASSTQVTTDPHTGEKKTKHKLGGAYPGNRRQGNNPYTPPPSAFSNGQATAHFVNYGGGNALVLKQDSGVAQPQMGATPIKQPEYIQVTLPPGVHAGQTIRVAAPDGRQNEIVVPDGFGPGMSFTVEFADGPPPNKMEEKPSYGHYETPTTTYTPGYQQNLTPYVTTPSSSSNNYSSPARATAATAPMATASATTGPTQDDGFASGFNNPNYLPHAGDARPVTY